MNPRLVAVGDNVVDCYPDLGVMYPGGNAVNVAVHARRLGAASGYLGAVGTDAAGRVVRAALAGEGVDLSLLRVVEGRNASATVRLVAGERKFTGGQEGVSRFRLTAADLERLAEADVVHTGECSLMEDQLPELATAARLLSFDFSERPWEYVEAHARHAGIAILSAPSGAREEAHALARRVRDLGPSTVAVTLGSQGAVLISGDETVWAPAEPVTVVDTLGAGDAFIARLLVGAVRGEDLPDLAAAATAYASAACASYGAFGHEAPLDATLATPRDAPAAVLPNSKESA
ncbi:PfkB family carbohydrate kinase [Nonomuraea roseoviolacea]|uniref:Fructoselysine 6-kinase n=1 Tax=Nonomuraea roseoviolacea subsp. carminata TaxID=160689 RepID=A0ABT1K9F9_9ACTN|nr:PfkB family carbohydrate kinase [Nonomuraea roseoviolacea]MCP2350244.1 fructoselysine 6-kinase [Nonomuraea roseoviolacea subsp. carminata]